MMYVGIDNGLNGGIVVLNENGKVVEVYNMPILKLEKNEYDIQEISRIFRNMVDGYDHNIIVFLEKAHVRPVQGIRAAFTTGLGLGIMQGILESLQVSYEVVNPTVWMKAVFEGNYNKENKKYSMIFAQRKWPETNWKRTERSTLIHDGITDAACIAHFGYLKNKGVTNGE